MLTQYVLPTGIYAFDAKIHHEIFRQRLLLDIL